MSWTVMVVLGIVGLALLMIVHEAGHYFIARAFGMRVLKFSIGFGPVLWSHQARESETVFQVALIPFLAYVQIAGMNPFEEVDPADKSSYANASVLARISTIFAGPLANYLFASVLFFAALMLAGKHIPTGGELEIAVTKEGAARQADMRDGDIISKIDGVPMKDFDQMRGVVLNSPGKPLNIEVLRDGKPVTLKVVPQREGESGPAQIGVMRRTVRVPVQVSEAAVDAVILPAKVVQALVVGLARIITLKEKPEFKGPPGIVMEVGKAAAEGWGDYLSFLGLLSAYLGGFNLVPFPALDGGRLMFLGYEAVTRRRPNARIEANVHFVGLVMLLLLITVVSVLDVTR